MPADAEHGRDLGGLEAVPQVQLDDLAVGGAQALAGVLEQGTRPRDPGARGASCAPGSGILTGPAGFGILTSRGAPGGSAAPSALGSGAPGAPSAPGGGALAGLVSRLGLPGAQGQQGFGARHGVQPRRRAVQVTQPAGPGGGGDKRVPHRLGGVGWIAEQGTAVLVEGIPVPVVGAGEPLRVTSHDRRAPLTVAHAPTVAVLWPY